MTKIAILIPVWGRSKELEKCLHQLKIFIEKCNNYEFIVIFICSNEDREVSKIMNLMIKYKDLPIYCTIQSNNFIGLKMNAGINTALEFGFDYLMNLGSDDLIHPYIMDLYAPYIESGYYVFGINTYGIYDRLKDESYIYRPDMKCKVNGQISIQPIGAGRMIHKSAIEEIIEKEGFLYDNDRQRGLDMNSGNKLIKHGYTMKVIGSGEFPYIVDIKSGNNINTIEDIIAMQPENFKMIDNNIFTNEFEL